MANGYEFELSDGRTLALVPSNDKDCAISHGDVMVTLSPSTGKFTVTARPGVKISNVAAVVRFERKEFNLENMVAGDPAAKSDFEIMRTCHICNGRDCCVTNACGSCGCGWICD